MTMRDAAGRAQKVAFPARLATTAETNRGLAFEYCLLTFGSSHNRAVSPQRWQKGEVLSIDSGGNYHGYIGDLCRMAVLGEPDAELQDLLGEIELVQAATWSPRARPR